MTTPIEKIYQLEHEINKKRSDIPGLGILTSIAMEIKADILMTDEQIKTMKAEITSLKQELEFHKQRYSALKQAQQ